MKSIHYIHAVVVDTDEFVPNNNDWNYYTEVDYAVHALYIQETEELVFLNDNIHSSGPDYIETFLDGVKYTGAAVYGEKMIAVVPVGCCYHRDIVKKVIEEQENLYDAVV